MGVPIGSELGVSVERLVGDPVGPVGSLVTVGAGLNVALLGSEVAIVGKTEGVKEGASVGILVEDPLGPVGSLVTVGAGLNVALLGSEVAIVGKPGGDTVGEEVVAQISGISRQIVGLKLGPGGERDGTTSLVGTSVSNIDGLVGGLV